MRVTAPGVTLIEVLVALIVVSATMTAVLRCKARCKKWCIATARSGARSNLLSRHLPAQCKKEPLEPGNTAEEKIDDFTVVYAVDKVSEQSVLARIENLVVEHINVLMATLIWAARIHAGAYNVSQVSTETERKRNSIYFP